MHFNIPFSWSQNARICFSNGNFNSIGNPINACRLPAEVEKLQFKSHFLHLQKDNTFLKL